MNGARAIVERRAVSELKHFQIRPAVVILRREAPKDLAAAHSAKVLDPTGGEILRGFAAQDDIRQVHPNPSLRP